MYSTWRVPVLYLTSVPSCQYPQYLITALSLSSASKGKRVVNHIRRTNHGRSSEKFTNSATDKF